MSRRWGITVTLLSLAIHCLICAHDPWARSAQGDGYYGYLFSRSLAYDGDIDFTNDYAKCGDPWHLGIDRGTGHPDNFFYFGQAAFWVPAHWLSRLVVPLPANAPVEWKMACKGPRTAFVLFMSPVVGAAALFLCYLIARRMARDGAAALATGLVGLCGTNLAYAGFMVSYSHVYASFAVAFLFWAALWASEGKGLRRWWLTAFAIALAVVQRPPTLVFAVVPLFIAWKTYRAERGSLLRVLGVLAAGAAAGLLPTILVYRYLYGNPFVVPQGRYYLFFGHAHPFLTLFAPRGGLFYAAPTAWLGVVGLVWAMRDRALRPLFVAMLLAAVVDVYVSASALDWHGAWGVGARRLTTLTPMLVAAAAFWFERVRRWLLRRPGRARTALGAALLVPMTVASFGLIDASSHDVMDPGSGHPQANFYGAGVRRVWDLLDRHVGDVFIYPAELAFYARYGLPPQSFRAATEPFVYTREFRADMNFRANGFPLDDARMKSITRGFEHPAGALRLAERRGRIVFAAEWPFATTYELTVHAAKPGVLRIGAGHAFGRVAWVGDASFTGGDVTQKLRIAIPKDEFDSGLNEIVVEREGDAPVDITSFRILDETKYPPAM